MHDILSGAVRSAILPPLSHPYMNLKVRMSSQSLPISHSSYSSLISLALLASLHLLLQWLSPHPLHPIPKLAPIFSSHFSDLWRAWGQKKPVPPKLHLLSNGLREGSLGKAAVLIFYLRSCSCWSVIITDVLASAAKTILLISCGGSLAVLCTCR